MKNRKRDNKKAQKQVGTGDKSGNKKQNIDQKASKIPSKGQKVNKSPKQAQKSSQPTSKTASKGSKFVKKAPKPVQNVTKVDADGNEFIEVDSDQVDDIIQNNDIPEDLEAEGEDSSSSSDEEMTFQKIREKHTKTDKNEHKRAKYDETPNEEEKDYQDSEYSHLDASFELVAPCESFFHSIKILVQQLCDEQKYDVSGLSDALIEQQSLGSVAVSTLDFDLDKKYADLDDAEFEKMKIKHNNDRDVYGITTVINFSKREKRPYLEDIYSYLMYRAKKHCDKAELKKFINILSTKKVGLFINERYINLPVMLIPKMLKDLPEDINFTKRQDDVENPSDYNFDYFLGIAKCSSDDLYYKLEEEQFVDSADLFFKFTCKTEEGADRYKRIIYLIKYSKYIETVNEDIDELFKTDP